MNAVESGRQASCRRLIALLEGDIAEMPLLSVAAQGSEMLETAAHLCWMGPTARPGRPLLAELAGAAGIHRIDEDDFDDLLGRDRVRALLISQSAWRRHAGRVWGRSMSTSIYVSRSGGWKPPRRIVCGAESVPTAEALVDRVRESLDIKAGEIAVVHAVPRPPLWAQTLCGLNGFAWTPPPPEQVRFRCRASSSVMVDWESPENAVRKACGAFRPDLVVLGWHRHSIPLPDRWLHRTAWRLSTELPHDVLLVPLTT